MSKGTFSMDRLFFYQTHLLVTTHLATALQSEITEYSNSPFRRLRPADPTITKSDPDKQQCSPRNSSKTLHRCPNHRSEMAKKKWPMAAEM